MLRRPMEPSAPGKRLPVGHRVTSCWEAARAPAARIPRPRETRPLVQFVWGRHRHWLWLVAVLFGRVTGAGAIVPKTS
jgi:hypothetical protein